MNLMVCFWIAPLKFSPSLDFSKIFHCLSQRPLFTPVIDSIFLVVSIFHFSFIVILPVLVSLLSLTFSNFPYWVLPFHFFFVFSSRFQIYFFHSFHQPLQFHFSFFVGFSKLFRLTFFRLNYLRLFISTIHLTSYILLSYLEFTLPGSPATAPLWTFRLTFLEVRSRSSSAVST